MVKNQEAHLYEVVPVFFECLVGVEGVRNGAIFQNVVDPLASVARPHNFAFGPSFLFLSKSFTPSSKMHSLNSFLFLLLHDTPFNRLGGHSV